MNRQRTNAGAKIAWRTSMCPRPMTTVIMVFCMMCTIAATAPAIVPDCYMLRDEENLFLGGREVRALTLTSVHNIDGELTGPERDANISDATPTRQQVESQYVRAFADIRSFGDAIKSGEDPAQAIRDVSDLTNHFLLDLCENAAQVQQNKMSEQEFLNRAAAWAFDPSHLGIVTYIGAVENGLILKLWCASRPLCVVARFCSPADDIAWHRSEEIYRFFADDKRPQLALVGRCGDLRFYVGEEAIAVRQQIVDTIARGQFVPGQLSKADATEFGFIDLEKKPTPLFGVRPEGGLLRP